MRLLRLYFWMTAHLIQALKEMQFFKRHFGRSGLLVRRGGESLNEEMGKMGGRFDQRGVAGCTWIKVCMGLKHRAEDKLGSSGVRARVAWNVVPRGLVSGLLIIRATVSIGKTSAKSYLNSQ